MKNIYDLTLKELEEYFISIGEKTFRGTQVYESLYKKRLTSFDEMTNISKELRNKLKEDFSFYKIKLLITQKGDNVNKYLFESCVYHMPSCITKKHGTLFKLMLISNHDRETYSDLANYFGLKT